MINIPSMIDLFPKLQLSMHYVIMLHVVIVLVCIHGMWNQNCKIT